VDESMKKTPTANPAMTVSAGYLSSGGGILERMAVFTCGLKHRGPKKFENFLATYYQISSKL
jgi:hypothetical protein